MQCHNPRRLQYLPPVCRAEGSSRRSQWVPFVRFRIPSTCRQNKETEPATASNAPELDRWDRELASLLSIVITVSWIRLNIAWGGLPASSLLESEPPPSEGSARSLAKCRCISKRTILPVTFLDRRSGSRDGSFRISIPCLHVDDNERTAGEIGSDGWRSPRRHPQQSVFSG